MKLIIVDYEIKRVVSEDGEVIHFKDLQDDMISNGEQLWDRYNTINTLLSTCDVVKVGDITYYHYYYRSLFDIFYDSRKKIKNYSQQKGTFVFDLYNDYGDFIQLTKPFYIALNIESNALIY